MLTTALLENESTVVLCARGGYGASDLLPILPWERLRKDAAQPKILVGFSDTSALHSAIWCQLGWRGIHGPMPATSLWPEGAIEKRDASADVTQLLEIISGTANGASINLESLNHAVKAGPTECRGWLFGGCFSVLTNLIGTPYLPAKLEGAILFFEDIGEHPARIVRFFNQWQQSGLLKGVRGVVWGSLTQLGQNLQDNSEFVYRELARRLGNVPCWRSNDFGHISPNWPLGIGSDAYIQQFNSGAAKLHWNFSKPVTGVTS
jgi:muramoyltetrapeptide carboxypeptidase